MWKNHIETSFLGNMKICDTVKSDVFKFYNELTRKGLRNGTIQLFQNIIFPCLQLAVDDNIIRTNPAKDCMKEFSGNDAKKKEALTVQEQTRLLNFITITKHKNLSSKGHIYAVNGLQMR